ncbi:MULTISPECIES: LytR/AlgR family response regulator transcription factor [unclassified Carboxylicivirga]|uniref:LytR/AlgR family response regulator transcription factor n=1 Tax=Carboxylicivirga TaxID=1628153 RepID=UPI003D356CFC
MEVVIIEDEKLLAEELKKELLAIDSSIRIVKQLGTVADSIAWLRANRCDLIFSDIELTDGLSLAIFKELNNTPPVIFITAYNQYAIKAFETNSIGYLLKPVESDDLVRVLDKYHQQQWHQSQLSRLMDQFQQAGAVTASSSYLNRLILRLGNVQKPVSVDEIVYFMADDRYLFAITQEGKRYYYDATLSQLENELDPDLFFRANRRYFINKHFVHEIITMSRSRLMIKMDAERHEDIVVSYSRSKEFKEWIIR